jgi:hypothetical protein
MESSRNAAVFQAERRACPELAEGISVSPDFAREPESPAPQLIFLL